MTRSELLRAAAEVLRVNDRGGYTVPSPKLYPHQWNWDSAFCAIGWAHLDPRRAATELAMLLRGQWSDGMIPHIAFNPAAEHYEPGPAAWHTLDVAGAPKAVRTSSITQPPIAATAARIVLERSGGDAEVERILALVVAGIEKWHAWFAATRDPLGEGLPCIVHPWESGMDNAPRWDAALARITPGPIVYRRVDDGIVSASQRPTRYDYDRYFFLVEERARRNFAPPRVGDEPFLLQDVAMAAILARAESDLAFLAEKFQIASAAASRRALLVGNLERKLFDEAGGRYLDCDLRDGILVAVDHVAGLLPLYSGAIAAGRAESLARRLFAPHAFAGLWSVPTSIVGAQDFEPERYWRGPIWINVNWMLIEGLRQFDMNERADELATRTLELITEHGFFEYFNPLTGEGLGTNGFAWTAALAIDLANR